MGTGAAGKKMGIDLNSRISALNEHFAPIVILNAPMADHTSFKIGGPADALAAPRDTAELEDLVAWCRNQDIPFMVLGAGTNLLVRDAGIRGVVISLKHFCEILRQPSDPGTVRVRTMAGARLGALCRYCLVHGLAGMNFALGIPGTVGGAIVMNAGTARGDIDSVLEDMTVLSPEGRLAQLKRPDFEFAYRRLRVCRKEFEDALIISGGFKLFPADPAALRIEAKQNMLSRKAGQPWRLASAGSFFKNPPSGEPAGRLIDLCGLKGFRIGDAQVSKIHANFIVNRGRAAASDVIAVMEVVRKTVHGRFNILLEPEVKIVGT